jgi:homoserine kinase type II
MPADPDLIRLLACWGVSAGAAVARAGSGTNNRTYVVRDGSLRWVLRISTQVPAARVQAEHRLLARLGRSGLPFRVPEPVATPGGDTVVQTSAGPAALFWWLEGVRPGLRTGPELGRFGYAVGLLDAALAGVPAEDAACDWRGDPLRIDPDGPDVGVIGRDLRAAGIEKERLSPLHTAALQVAEWWSTSRDHLPVQVIHADTTASNTLVDRCSGRVTALLDFEFAGVGFRVLEVAVALLQSRALEGTGWPGRATALIRGYTGVTALGRPEAEALPPLVLSRSIGSLLWRAQGWRHGHAQLADVIERLDRLGATTRWLAASSQQLVSLASGTQ